MSVIPVVGLLVALAVTAIQCWHNLSSHRFPDRISIAGAVATLAGFGVDAVLAERVSALVFGAAGGSCMFLLLFIVILINPRLLGFGTVKASFPIGAAAGALGVAAWLTAAAVLLIPQLAVLPLSRYLRGHDVPLGPLLLLALVAGVGVGIAAT